MNSFSDRVVRRLPPGVLHYPMDALIAFLGTLSGALSLVGLSRGQVLAYFPEWARLVWGFLFLFGCVCWSVGILSVVKIDQRVVIRRVPVMVLGLGFVGVSSLFYALAVLFIAGWTGVTVALPLLAVAIGAYLRRWKLMNLDDHE